uniref:Uncharacterized protein n=1 Tax=Arundo donax TaxID=35708 RepID=A0A0A9DXQ3_ARUDO
MERDFLAAIGKEQEKGREEPGTRPPPPFAASRAGGFLIRAVLRFVACRGGLGSVQFGEMPPWCAAEFSPHLSLSVPLFSLSLFLPKDRREGEGERERGIGVWLAWLPNSF